MNIGNKSMHLNTEKQETEGRVPVSKRYFEKAKVLFGVKTVEEYKEMASSLNDPNFHYDGYHMIPSILKALSVDTVATIV